MDTSKNPPPSYASTAPGKKQGYRRLIITIAVILAAVFIFLIGRALWTSMAGKKKPAQKPVPVLLSPATKGDIGVSIDALGLVTPLATVTVKTRVYGQLLAVNFKEGQTVKKGDSLAEVDPEVYQAQLTQAQGQLQRDNALLEEAKTDLKRYQDAFTHNAIPKQQLDDQAQLVQQDEGTVKNDQGMLESAKIQLQFCHITSPIDGRVGLRMVDPGNIVQTTDTTGIAVLAQMQPITVVFSVAEDYLPQIQSQMAAGTALTLQALDRDEKNKIASGSLQSIDSEIDPTTGTVKLKAQFPNTDNALFPSQFVNIRLLIQTIHDATLIPSAAIQRNDQNTFVYAVGSDETAQMQSVTVETTSGETVAVKGIEPGTRVVVDGFDKLQNGIKVQIQTPGTNEDAKQTGAPQAPPTGAHKQKKSSS